jgi:hypothetical protein
MCGHPSRNSSLRNYLRNYPAIFLASLICFALLLSTRTVITLRSFSAARSTAPGAL